jgi:hypothetical protein
VPAAKTTPFACKKAFLTDRCTHLILIRTPLKHTTPQSQEFISYLFSFLLINHPPDQMEAADRASLAQETLMKDESLAVRVATEVARALNLTVCVASMYVVYLLLISIFIFLSFIIYETLHHIRLDLSLTQHIK